MAKLEKIYSNVFLIIMLVAFPLVLTDGYFNVSSTKRAILLVGAAVLIIGEVVAKRLNLKIEKNSLLYVIFLSIIMSLIMAEDKNKAFLGSDTFGMGVGLAIVLIVLIAAVRTMRVDIELFCYLGCGVVIFEVLFSLLQFCGVDLYGLLTRLTTASTLENFLGTMGNTSFFGFFVIIMLAFALYATTLNSEIRFLAMVSVFFCGIGVVIANTDSAVIGFFVVLLLDFFIFGKRQESIKLFFIDLSIIGLAFGFLKVLFLITTSERNLSYFGGLLANPITATIFIIIGIAGFLLLDKKSDSDVFDTRLVTKIVTIVIIFFIALFIAASIIYTNVNEIRPDSRVADFLYLDYKWGNGRGYIWSRALEHYWNGSILQRLFGRGASSFYNSFIGAYQDEMLALMNTLYNDAHNMYIQTLFEYGAFGLTALIVLIIGAFKVGFESKNLFTRMCAVALLAASIMSFLLVIQCITPCFMALLIGLCYNENYFMKEANSDE